MTLLKFSSQAKCLLRDIFLCAAFHLVSPNTVCSDSRTITFVLAEREYGTNKSVPEFFESELKPLGFRGTFVNASPEGNSRNDLVGLERALGKSDLLFVSVRRRAPKTSQMQSLRKWIKSGKPVIGIRTSSHAFHLRGKPAPAGHELWEEWDSEVFGGSYSGHHGNQFKTWYRLAPDATHHPITTGLTPFDEMVSGGSLYKVLPLSESTRVLALGRAESIKQLEPVAWTNRPKTGNRVFYTSLGHVADFKSKNFRLILLNAVHWALKLKPPGKLQ